MTIEDVQKRVSDLQQAIITDERGLATVDAEMSEVERQLGLCEQQAKQLGVDSLEDLDVAILKLSGELESELGSPEVPTN